MKFNFSLGNIRKAVSQRNENLQTEKLQIVLKTFYQVEIHIVKSLIFSIVNEEVSYN